MNIVETENLVKAFGDTVAIDHVSINVGEGEIYGFLGLNGAGKTTAIRMLLAMISPDEGTIALFGQRLKKSSPFWNDVGFLVETPSSYPDLTVKENLEYVFRLRGLKDKTQITSIIDKLQLTAYQDRKVKYLSLGNGQRLGLAKALMHKPKLLILDEPINGLDPAGIVEIRELLQDLVNNHHSTIFLSSHILSEISKIATRIGIVHNGRLLKEINTHELEQQVVKKLCVDTTDNSKALQLLKDKGFNFNLNIGQSIESKDLKAIKQPEMIAELLVNSGVPPRLLKVEEEDLESYFLRIIASI